MKEITIITPTYNREKTLPSVYNSLLRQTQKNFIWMVIDDGSTDNTEKLISKYIKENKINIKYIKKENGGKASALNVGLDLVATEYCCCLDSDDTFVPNAVSTALKLLEEEKNNEKCCGVLALRTDEKGIVLGGREIPKKYKYLSVPKLYQIVNETELICFYKYKCIKEIRFPLIIGEKFISPTWFQYKATEKYLFRITNSEICTCIYLNDGLTKNKKSIIKKNPKGYTLMKKESLKYAKNPFKILKHAIMYDCGSILSNDKNWLKNSPKKITCFLCYPASYLIYLKKFKN